MEMRKKEVTPIPKVIHTNDKEYSAGYYKL